HLVVDVVLPELRIGLGRQRVDATAVDEPGREVVDVVGTDAGVSAGRGGGVAVGASGISRAPTPADGDRGVRQVGAGVVVNGRRVGVLDPEPDTAVVLAGRVRDVVVHDPIAGHDVPLVVRMVVDRLDPAHLHGIRGDVPEEVPDQ